VLNIENWDRIRNFQTFDQEEWLYISQTVRGKPLFTMDH